MKRKDLKEILVDAGYLTSVIRRWENIKLYKPTDKAFQHGLAEWKEDEYGEKKRRGAGRAYLLQVNAVRDLVELTQIQYM